MQTKVIQAYSSYCVTELHNKTQIHMISHRRKYIIIMIHYKFSLVTFVPPDLSLSSSYDVLNQFGGF